MKIENERLYYGGPIRRARWWRRPALAVRRWQGRRQMRGWVVLGGAIKRRKQPPEGR